MIMTVLQYFGFNYVFLMTLIELTALIVFAVVTVWGVQCIVESICKIFKRR